MKNWEFYEKELKNYGFGFTIKDNQAYYCSDVPCGECMFHTNTSRRCNDLKIEWLYQEYKRPIVLTDDEKSLCKLLGRGWIARDNNGDLWWYEIKPKKKNSSIWILPNVLTNLQIGIAFPQCKFNFIKWEDEEPWKVEVDD